MAQRILAQNCDTSPVFLTIMRTRTGTYTNSTGSTVTLDAGRLVGRILATGNIAPQSCVATDGSEMPIGVLMEGYSVADGASVTVTYAYQGEINESSVGLTSGQTLNDTVRTVSTGGGKLIDLIIRDTDLKLVSADDLTGYDNAVS
jgi:hypothetical protein